MLDGYGTPWRIEARLDEKPWGGLSLADLGFALPPARPIGEAVITAGEAVVADGEFAGAALAEVVAADSLGVVAERGLAATDGRPLFPLLIKLLDANQPLSLQAHPDDRRPPAGCLGKTEAWHVLAAAPAATTAVGLRSGTTKDTFAPESPHVIACLAGDLRMTTARGATMVSSGQSAIVPAHSPAGCVAADAPARPLRAWVPDLRADAIGPCPGSNHPAPRIAAPADTSPG